MIGLISVVGPQLLPIVVYQQPVRPILSSVLTTFADTCTRCLAALYVLLKNAYNHYVENVTIKDNGQNENISLLSING